ncbi:hypothetical protein CONLIGDRAFT_7936 [Coniochaeta ligniaria NRRL 30616]|uniref:Uncharacterized protein n=1 Tax=Coniochaeta ligniaria NRRL 30616 TaxID=1408157 RepID=A0A1J7J573_9PEZI|nr:hypothetical protein CONLIGDRAFT_7936 [Coniochaeta ligniaria NRRL 30616]
MGGQSKEELQATISYRVRCPVINGFLSNIFERDSSERELQRRHNNELKATELAVDGLADDAFLLIKQPDSKRIPQEKLLEEVKGIYAGFAMVEVKCIEVDNTQTRRGATTATMRTRSNDNLRRPTFEYQPATLIILGSESTARWCFQERCNSSIRTVNGNAPSLTLCSLLQCTLR